MKPETRFRKNQVLPFLKTLKNTSFFAIQQVAISGDPDFLLCMRGHFVALELKASGGKLRALQKYKLAEVEGHGGIALVADPDNWEQVKKTLLMLDGEKP